MADAKDELARLIHELPLIEMTEARIASVNNGGGEFWVYFIDDFEDIPFGTEGIVVYVHGKGEAYEVEVGPFDKQGAPSNGVKTVPSNKLTVPSNKLRGGKLRGGKND